MAVNGAMSAAEFNLAPSRRLCLSRVNLMILDGGIQPERFGGLLGGLANGLLIEVYDEDDVLRLDLLDGLTIKRNAHFTWLSGTDAPVIAGVGDDKLPVRWSLHKAFVGGFQEGADPSSSTRDGLLLPAGWNLRFTVQDDLSALTEFYAFGQGSYVD
jgi:hypothetical protein